MAPNKNRWPGILFMIPLACFGCFFAGCKSNRPAEEAQPAAEEAGTARSAPPPSYIPLNESSLQEHEIGAEYLLSGVVTGALGDALPGATVSVSASAPRWSPPAFEQPAPLGTQTCDDKGQYQIRMKSPANLWANIRKDGYASIDVLLPVRDPRIVTRDYQLQPASSGVEGIVFDKQETPIAGALVVVNTPPVAHIADSPILAPAGRLSDSTGKFTIDGLADGEVSVIVSARGYAEQEELITLKAGQSELVNFHLSAANAISFEVKTGRGETIPYATATAPGFFKIAGGNKRGVIEFSVPRELSPFECTVVADGYRANTIQLDPKAPPSAVVLEERPVLKGRVLTESGAAVAGAQVSVFGKGGAQGKFDALVETDKTGRFSLPLSYPPVREVKASRTGYFDQRLAFDDSKPAPSEVVVRLKPVEAGIYGRVIDYRGLPVKRFVVHVRNTTQAPGSQEYQRSFSSESGRFMVTDIAPRTYSLTIQSVLSATTDSVQLFNLEGVEVRKGFLFGEIIAQFPKPAFKK